MSREPEGASTISFVFEGREIHCRSEVSVAAALADAGEFGLRASGDGDLRGVFCGMGVCQECRVSIDGEHGKRACMTSAKSGMQISRGNVPQVGGSSRTGGDGSRQNEVLEPELLVIGGGAGGLTAASIAAEAGVNVVLLDERNAAGGQYFKQPVNESLLPASLSGDKQIIGGAQLVERALRSGAKIVGGAQVWGAFAPAEFGVIDDSGSTVYRPKRTIVATGAYQGALPVPGWTLPGVMTTGAAQGMLRNYGTVLPGRIVVAGNGPLNLQIASELKAAGADVRLVVELADPGPASWIVNGLQMAYRVPRLVADGIGFLLHLRKTGVPVRFGAGVAAIRKSKHGLEVDIGPIGADEDHQFESIEADVVCVGYGFQPRNEILRCLGCRHSFDQARGYLVTERSEECETTVPGVYAVGDCTALNGGPAAMQDGVISAVEVLRSLDYRLSAHHKAESGRAIRERRRHRSFQSALWALFAAPRLSTQLAAADTVLCRCENVTLDDVEAALGDGAASMGGIKQRTRLGMGPCQGRYCATVVADLLSQRTGKPIDEFSFFAPRPPLKPIRIADIVGNGKTLSTSGK